MSLHYPGAALNTVFNMLCAACGKTGPRQIEGNRKDDASVICDIYGACSLLHVFKISTAASGLCSAVSRFTDFITMTDLPFAVPHTPSCKPTQLQLQTPPSLSSSVHLECKYGKGVAAMGFLICNSELTKLPGSY